MNLRITRLLALALALSASATPVLAGTLANDYSSYLGSWNGSAGYQGYDPITSAPTGLTGYIDFAVYTDTQYNANFPLSGYTPTPGEFVYTYQATETGAADLSSVSVNLSPAQPADNIGTFSGTDLSAFLIPPLPNTVNGDAPIDDYLVPNDSANWDFSGVSTNHSTIGLVFSSPDVPMWSTASTIDGGSVGIAYPVPSPDGATNPTTPEPGTLALAFSGLAAFALYRFSKGSRRRRIAS